VATLADALQITRFYRQRWTLELVFRVTKSFDIEAVRVAENAVREPDHRDADVGWAKRQRAPPPLSENRRKMVGTERCAFAHPTALPDQARG
jgi:hypothetical protein